MTVRSYLYVPGIDLDKLRKAPGRGADAIIADLEDGVAAGAKIEARTIVGTWLDQRDRRSTVQTWIRVNNDSRWRADDLRITIDRGVSGIVLPKATVETLGIVSQELAVLEKDIAVEHRLRILPLVESARGLHEVDDLAQHPRVSHLGVGQVDLQSELGLDPEENESEWTPIRLRLVIASAFAAIQPPIGPTWTSITDLQGLETTSKRLRRLGYRGRTAIHPAQLEVINRIFTPSMEKVERAREVVRLFEEALTKGQAVTVDSEGRLIDEAVVRVARNTLDLAPRTDE